jgi:UDP-GlcNAc:undecaprenyl-phosphate GlcNAc-1-phosphate transferase
VGKRGNSKMATVMAIFVVALAFAGVSTPLIQRLATRLGFMALPRQDRAHHYPTAMMGGVAIYAGAILALLAAMVLTPLILGRVLRLPELFGILTAATLMAAIGLWDDRKALKPYLKLVCQLVPVIIVMLAGVRVSLRVPLVINLLITACWLLYITNAVNYLDNLDGIATMVAAVSGAFFTLIAVLNGQRLVSMLAAALTGASLGFARYNLPLPRARIFMGDAGALFLGFMLAVLGIKLRVPGNTSYVTWMVPVIVLGLPIFDTALVIISRRRRGVSFFRGGVDHTTHRLKRLGMDDLSVALSIGLINGALGILATFVMQAEIWEAYAVAAALSLLALYVIWMIEIRASDDIRVG